MTIAPIAAGPAAAVPAPSPTAAAPGGRDRAIDLVRATCVLGVVVLHALMVGVTVSDAGPSFVNASDGTAWITPLSWVLQVMPLFFVIGGFSGAVAFRRDRARGRNGVDFVARRLHRLLLPAAVVIAAVAAALALLQLAGVPADLVAVAGHRYGQPLWFLAVFVVCQALLPALLRSHDRAPLRTIALLALAAAAVDAVRLATGIEGLGFLNLGFVWLTLQQLGFFLADGRIDALPVRVRALAAAGAVGALALSFATGVHSPDLVANINPPTTALLLVGVAHTALFSLLRRPLARLAARPAPAAFVGFVTPRAMTVYLWHMPVLLCLAGLTAGAAMVGGVALPPLDTAAWFAGRPLWLALAIGITMLVALPLARLEAAAAPRPTGSVARVTGATALGVAGIALLLVAGTTVLTAALAVTALVVSLRLARQAGARQPRATPALAAA